MILRDLYEWLRLRPRIFGQAIALTPSQKALVEKWKKNISLATGLPEEAIKDEVAYKWLINWMKALVKPEYWKELGLE